MIVAIDAGNSRIKWGCHDGTAWKERGNVPTDEAERLADVAARWPRAARVVASSVAGPGQSMWPLTAVPCPSST